MQEKLAFFKKIRKKCACACIYQKKAVPLHAFLKNNTDYGIKRYNTDTDDAGSGPQGGERGGTGGAAYQVPQ